MKKVLLAGTALVGVAALTTPAHADLKLDLGGYFRGYAVYADNQENTADGPSLMKYGIQKDAEVHFTGETTTDMGLTVGAHFEMKMLPQTGGLNTGSNQVTPQTQWNYAASHQEGFAPTIDESYAYFSGGWGRVNFGAEDGAAYLLQVAAPSADSNVDGLRPVIQGFVSDVWNDKTVNQNWVTPWHANSNGYTNTVLGYDNADFQHAERITYLTPKWSGFQAGVSYAPTQGLQAVGFTGMAIKGGQNNQPEYKNLWEASARWDGEFQGFGISAGAGYSSASAANKGWAGAGNFGTRNLDTWDAGLNFTWQGWSLGGAYKWSNTGTSGGNNDFRVWDAGLGWDNGPWHAGLSWWDGRWDQNAYGGNFDLSGDLKIDRYTIGGGYTYGPGVGFRGALAWMNVKNSNTTGGEGNQTPFQVTLGTDINF